MQEPYGGRRERYATLRSIRWARAMTCLYVKLVQRSGDRLFADRLNRIEISDSTRCANVFNDIVAFHAFSSRSLRITGIASDWRLGRPARRLPTTEALSLRRFLNSERAHFSTSLSENAEGNAAKISVRTARPTYHELMFLGRKNVKSPPRGLRSNSTSRVRLPSMRRRRPFTPNAKTSTLPRSTPRQSSALASSIALPSAASVPSSRNCITCG